jgi:hypothetical protein
MDYGTQAYESQPRFEPSTFQIKVKNSTTTPNAIGHVSKRFTAALFFKTMLNTIIISFCVGGWIILK